MWACRKVVVCLILAVTSAPQPVFATGVVGTQTSTAGESVASDGKTELMLSARAGNSDRVRQLLASGANVNRANRNGGTPLMYAALGGNLKVVKAMIEVGADINAAAENGWSALMIASTKGYVDIVAELLTRGADPNRSDIYGWTPIMRAVYENRKKVFVQLMQHKDTDFDHRGENGVTALHIAVAGGDVYFTARLVESGADTTIRDHAGRTPAAIATAGNNHKILNILNK